MATDQYQLTLADYLFILNSHKRFLAAIFTTIYVMVIIVAFSISPVYKSSGTILVESPSGSGGVLSDASRNNLEELISGIKERVLSRDSLMSINDKYNLFAVKTGSLTATDIAGQLRKVIEVNSTVLNTRRGSPSISILIAFENQNPEVTYNVTKDLVSLFIDWNHKLRITGAEETHGFLSDEANRIKVDVDRLDEKIADFKRRNKNNLPEQMNIRESLVARSENDLYSVERDIRSGNDELRTLQAQLAASKQGLSDNPAESLEALRAQYTKLTSIYTQEHPDVRALKRKIDALEQQGNSTNESNRPIGGAATNLAEFRIQSSINSVKSRLQSLEQQKKMLEEKIAQNQNSMEATPLVSNELEILIRDRDAALKKFDEMREKKMDARIEKNLESEHKGERLTVIESPMMPDSPSKPNRTKILFLGFFLAIGASVGSTMLIELREKRIYGPDSFFSLLGYRPFAVIPLLPTPEDDEQIEKKKKLKKWILIGGAVLFLIFLLVVNFLFMPLDDIFLKISART